MDSGALSYENPVFRVYITWCGLLIVKLLLMAPLTGFQRIKNKSFANPEDAAAFHGEIKADDNVERVRRAHMNDLESIPAFLVAALFYVMSKPNADVATWLIRIAVLARIGHTIVYAIRPVQSIRLICFATAALITVFMTIWSMVQFLEF